MTDANVATPQPSSTPSPSQGINWKNIIISVVIGAVLFGGGGYLVYNAYQSKKEEATQPTTTKETITQPTSKIPKDWKTYQNSVTDISIKYAPNLSYLEESKVEGNLATAAFIPPGGNLSSVGFKLSPDGKEIFSILSSLNYAEGKPVPVGFAKLYSETFKSTSAAKLETSKVQIDGTTAYKAIFPESDLLTTWIIFIDSPDKKSAYTIYTSFSKSNRETVVKMISTFKFLN